MLGYSTKKLSHKASASKFRRIVSAVGTTPLQSPGWNEGKARTETLGIHERKVISSSLGTALTERVFVLRLRSVAPLELNKCVSLIHPGLAPWAMQEYRPKGLSSTSSYHLLFWCGCPDVCTRLDTNASIDNRCIKLVTCETARAVSH